MRSWWYLVVIENHVMLQHHAINLPRAERPEGSRKLEPVFHPNLLLAQTVGTLHNSILETKFI